MKLINGKNEVVQYNELGISKRFYAACAAMQGLLSNPNIFSSNEDIVMAAYDMADKLLKQENNE